jgi:hypothetical protein
MSSIVRDGHTFHGTSVCGRGVFQITKLGITYVYAGQIMNNSACGLGVLTRSCGKAFAEYDPYGKLDGRFVYVSRDANVPGGLAGYILFEHGVPKERAWIHGTGERSYNGEFCAPDDPRVHALIARVAPVEALAAAEAEKAEEAVADLPRRLAGLELMVTVLLARGRRQPTVTGIVAELLTLQSGLLAMVCEAIVL